MNGPGREPAHRSLRRIGILGAAFVATVLAACGGSSSPVAGSGSGSQAADDLPETALQGQVPLTDQLSGRAAQGYRKGLRLVGQNTVMDRGANFNLAWVGDCAYVTTTSAAATFTGTTPYLSFGLTPEPMNGLAVIDAADAAHPRLLGIKQSPVMIRTHESLQGNEARKLIVATTVAGNQFEVWDASDCRNPVLAGSTTMGDGIPLTINGTNFNQGVTFRGHALCITDDGLTAYATGAPTTNAILDLSDIHHPRSLGLFVPTAHDCGLSPDGNRLYLAVFGGIALGVPQTVISLATANLLGNEGYNGLVIFDVSDYQKRVANPQLRIVSKLQWTDAGENQNANGGGHTMRWFQNGGRTYLYSSDEWPIAAQCPWTHARIIDISDETHPVKVSDLTLQVQQSANCPLTDADIANYSMHYVGVDDVHNATTLFISAYAAGLRVWDIHDPAQPKEIAYYHPVPNTANGAADASPGSEVFQSSGNRWDAVPSYIRYRPESGQIWLSSASAGFQILEFTPTAGPTAPRPAAGK